MIKHSCICDRCGKEEDLKVKYCVGQDSEQPVIYNLPDRWEHFGIMPKYQLCGKCSADMKVKIERLIYTTVNESKNMDKDSE